MIKSKKYYLAKSKVQYQPNTFIGGVSGTLNTPALVAAKLGINVNRITAFSIIGSNIQFAVTGGSYTIATSAFSGNTAFTSYNDVDGLVLQINEQAFFSASNATYYNFPNLTTIVSSSGSFGSVGIGTFRNNTSLLSFNAPKLTTILGWNTFRDNTSLVSFNCPLYTISNGGCNFYGNSNLVNLIIGKITYLGESEYYNCSKLTTIDLSEVSSLGGTSQFSQCLLLTNVVSIDKLPFISQSMFSNSKLTGSITANSATSIGLGAFYICPDVTSYSFPLVTTIVSGGVSGGSGGGTFRENTSLTSFSAPLLTSISGWSAFRQAIALVTFYTPNLSILGGGVIDNFVFNSIKTGCTITVAASMATANAGAPDGDLVYAATSRAATIVYV